MLPQSSSAWQPAHRFGVGIDTSRYGHLQQFARPGCTVVGVPTTATATWPVGGSPKQSTQVECECPL